MNNSTLLLRQIHPSFLHDGKPSSQAFRPTPKDKENLSVYDNDQIEADEAWKHYTQVQQNVSCGVMAVKKEECEALSLLVHPDPTPFPEHVLIDFSGHSKKAIENKAKQLKENAIQRGWLFKNTGV